MAVGAFILAKNVSESVMILWKVHEALGPDVSKTNAVTSNDQDVPFQTTTNRTPGLLCYTLFCCNCYQLDTQRHAIDFEAQLGICVAQY